MAYDLPALRKKLLPTLADALKAMRQADDRDERARDTRPLMAMLMRVVQADPRLGGYLTTRRTALTSFDFVVEPVPGDSRGTEDGAAETYARVRRVADTVMNRACEVALYGALAFKLQWEAAGDLGVTPTVAQDYDPDELARPSRRLAELRVLAWTGNARPSATPVATNGTMLAAVDESHWTGGVLRSVLIREILLDGGLREWAGYIRKLKGIIGAAFEGEVPPVGDPERTAAETALQTLTADNYHLTSDRLKFEFSKLVEAASGGSFKDFKGELEADVAIAVLGQANTAQMPDGGGSRAGLQVLNLIRADIHHADMRTAEAICEELVLWDYRFNTDQAAVTSPYRLRIALETDDGAGAEQAEAARGIGEAMDALDGTGAGLPTDEVYARLRFTRPEGLPDVLTRSRATVPGLPPGPDA